MPTKRKKVQPVFGWAGVTEGELDLKMSLVNAYPPIAYGIVYPTRKDAKRFYVSVRRVVVKPL